MRRVAITGMGMVTPLGLGVQENWQKVIAGQSAVDLIRSFDPAGFSTKIGAEIRDFNPRAYIKDKKSLKLMNKGMQNILAVTHMALEDAQLALDSVDLSRIGLYVASGQSEFKTEDFFPALEVAIDQSGKIDYAKFGSQGMANLNPYLALITLANGGLSHVSMTHNITGSNLNILASGPAGAQAVGRAYRAIQRAEADIALVGAYDTYLVVQALLCHQSAGVLSRRNDNPKKAMRPFDLSRDGFVLGEGAGLMVLEELSSALKRGAQIYAELSGYGCSFDTYDFAKMSPDGKGISRTIELALADGAIPKDKIGYIAAYGDATIQGDAIETKAIKNVFGKQAYQIPISALKPMFGDCGAASSLIECMMSALATQQGVLPPTINYETPDPVCDLDYIPNQARKADIDYALSLTRNVRGGQHIALLVGKYSGGSNGEHS